MVILNILNLVIKMAEFKILLLGDSTVGKTTFLERYCGEDFKQNLGTMGIDSKIKDIEKNNIEIKLRIYDTAGQERFRSIVKNYYKGADGIILIYDVSNINSFNAIKIWIESIKESIDLEKIGFIVVENKCDLPDEEKKINKEMRNEMEKIIGFEIIIASAKDKTNVDESFDLLIDKMLKFKEKKENITSPNSIKIENNPKDKSKKKKGDCCLSHKKK